MTDVAPSRAVNRQEITNKVKVLYICGWGRSGSTVLGRILGQVEDFFLVGEMRYIWDRGIIEDRLCSCGERFSSCPVWGNIMARTGSPNRDFARRMISSREKGLRNRHLLFSPSKSWLRSHTTDMGEYMRTLDLLYRASLQASGSRVIVDTSKFPSYGFLLQDAPGIDLYVLHLVRDPRPVAHSWSSRRKVKPDHGTDAGKRLMTPHGLLESAATWGQWNLSIERFLREKPERYMLLRYEDFVGSPREHTHRVLHFMGEGASPMPFAGERKVHLDAPHTFSGNPDRFQNGVIEISPDESWRSRMSVPRKAAVTALTWPGMMRYGYPLMP